MDDRIFPYEWEQKIIPHPKDKILLADFEDGDEIKYANYEDFKGEKGAQVVSAAINDDDIVFSLDDGTTATLVDGAKDLKGKDGEDGQDGEDGDAVEFRVNEGYIEWKLTQDIGRTILTPLTALKGDKGGTINGVAWDNNDIKFTLDDDTSISLANAKIVLKGDPGIKGNPGVPGNPGADGKEIQLRNTSIYIQRKYNTDVLRNNLISLDEIKGKDGEDGNDGEDGSDGREIELQTNATHIQWKYDTSGSWTNLIALSALKGDKGAKITSVGWDNDDIKFVLDDSSSVSLTNAKTTLKGEQGLPGPVGIKRKEAWVAGTYDKGDGVSKDGTSYIAKENTSGVPGVSADWDVIAEKGQAGEGSGDMLAENNLSDLADKATARTNLDVYSKTETDTKISEHTPDLTNYYTKTDTDTKLELKANQATTYTKTEVDTKLGGKANSSHTHTIADVTNLQTSLDAKANQSTTYTKTETDTKLGKKANLVDGKIPASELPSYVDDVVEASNQASLPATGEAGKIYITTDNNKVFRRSGTAYLEIVASPGSTDAVPEGATNKYFTEARAKSALATELAGKQDTLTAGTNVSISGTTISATDTKYSTISEANIKNASHTTGGLITGQRAEQLMANEATKARTISNKKLGNDLDANSKKITNLANGTNNGDAVNVSQLNSKGDMSKSTYDTNNNGSVDKADKLLNQSGVAQALWTGTASAIPSTKDPNTIYLGTEA